MKLFYFKRPLARKWISLSMIFTFFFLYFLIPLGLDNARETTLQVENTLADVGRGTYDILVRPPSSRSLIETKLGLVEENYIGDSTGGISISEWEEIKKDKDIEVAAPVASIGYFTGKNVSLHFPVLPNPSRISYQFYTSDGLQKYPINDPNYIYFFEEKNGTIQYIQNMDTLPSFSDRFMMAMLPSRYYLLTAVDVESEKQLTGIDFSQLLADLPPDKISELEWIKETQGDIPIIKILQREDLEIPLEISLEIDNLELDLEEYQKKLGVNSNESLISTSDIESLTLAFDELSKKQPLTSQEIRIDLSNYQKPFDGTVIKINENFQVEEAHATFFGNRDSYKYYTASKLDYNNDTDKLVVNIEEDGNPPSYKELKTHGVDAELSDQIPYLLEQVGTFAPTIDNNNQLVSSPLGIYSTTNTFTEKNEIVTPTIIPGNFIPHPASGITTLDSAEILKGERPIDAIRIRVAGIDSYNDTAQMKIGKVATRLLEKGFEVDIVAGSSFQQVPVEVEGIGNVTMPWTTLGIAQKILTSSNGFLLISIYLLLLFAVTWTVNRLVFERNILVQENELLSTIGWSRKQIKLANNVEYFILISISLIMTLVANLLIKAPINNSLYAVLFWIISLFIVYLVLNKRTKENVRTVAFKYLSSIFYYKSIFVPLVFIILLATILLVVQIANLGSLIEELSVTSMGTYISEITFWLNVTLLIFIAFLSITGVSECTNALLIKRKSEFEMYYSIGWQKQEIIKFLLKELSIPVLGSIILGIFISVVILNIFAISSIWIIISTTITSIIFIAFQVVIVFSRLLTKV